MLNAKTSFREYDKTISRLLQVLTPEMIHRTAGNRAYTQVKGRYSERFSAQVNNSSKWQQFKKLVRVPSGGLPGFFTGTTYNAIKWDANDSVARIFLSGMWPSGSYSYSDQGGKGAAVKWGGGQDGVYAAIPTSDDKVFRRVMPSEQMSTKQYGKNGQIQFMVLDQSDISLVRQDVKRLLLNAAQGTGDLK